MPETATRTKPARSARDAGRSELAPLRVRYFRRMKPQRVYPWVVSWQRAKDDRKGPNQDVTLRLLIAGAQVLPTEQTINADDPKAQATFYVTPLAKGWLKAVRLEVLVAGRKVQEIPLASQVAGQRRTWGLLFLAFFLPWFIWSYFEYSPLDYRLVLDKGVLVTKKVQARNLEPVALFVKEVMPAELNDLAKEEIGVNLPYLVGALYDEASIEMKENNVGFFAGVLFLVLALFSAFFRRTKRKTAIGKPILALASGRGEETGDEE